MLYISNARITFQMASLECPRTLFFQQRSNSRILIGMIHETLNQMRTKCQILLVNSQWMRRLFTVSSLFLQRQHQLTGVRPRLLRLSIMRILSKASVQVKKVIRDGAFTLNMNNPYLRIVLLMCHSTRINNLNTMPSLLIRKIGQLSEWTTGL
jgi:hypothetical protein